MKTLESTTSFMAIMVGMLWDGPTPPDPPPRKEPVHKPMQAWTAAGIMHCSWDASSRKPENVLLQTGSAEQEMVRGKRGLFERRDQS